MITPKRIIHNDRATIIFWDDHTKTVVRCAEGTTPNNYAAFCAALAKKIYGGNSKVKNIIATAENYVPFKVGDKVKVMTIEGAYVGDAAEMQKMVGKTFVIKSISPNGLIFFEKNEGGYAFFPQWLKKLEKPKSAKYNFKMFKAGDKIRLLDGSAVENFSGTWQDYMIEDVGRVCTIKEIKNYELSTGVKVKENTDWTIWDIRAIEKV